MTQQTDPALEIARLSQFLMSIPTQGNNAAGIAIASRLQLDPQTADFSELMAMGLRRIEDLRNWALDIDDGDFDELQRKQVIQALERLSQAFVPLNMAQDWSHIRKTHVREEDLLAIRWFSHVARRYRRLRLFTDDERSAAIDKIQASLEALDDDAGDLEDWKAVVLSDGLRRLMLMLSFVDFFGHEIAIDQLLSINEKVRAFESNASPKAKMKLKAVLATVRMVAEIFILPHEVHEAYHTYRGWALEVVAPAHEQKLLIAPDTVEALDVGQESNA